MTQPEKKIIVGFWYRLLSDIIDAIILGVFGFLLVLPLKSFFYSLGESGLFIGLAITFLYTGILQSYIGKGQSIAKMLLKIQVVSIDGSFLSLSKSFFRYSIIALIFYNSWIWLSITSIFPFLNNVIFQSIFTLIIVFLFFGVTFLLAFHPLKRGIHDILAGSMVIRKNSYNIEQIEALNIKAKVKRAFIIWGIACISLITISITLFIKYDDTSKPLLFELTRIQQSVGEQTNFKNISATHNWQTYTNTDGIEQTTTRIVIRPFLKKDIFDDENGRMREIEKAVKLIAESYSKIEECNFINVQVRTGFNIGISSFYQTVGYEFDNKGNSTRHDTETNTSFKIGS